MKFVTDLIRNRHKVSVRGFGLQSKSSDPGGPSASQLFIPVPERCPIPNRAVPWYSVSIPKSHIFSKLITSDRSGRRSFYDLPALKLSNYNFFLSMGDTYSIKSNSYRYHLTFVGSHFSSFIFRQKLRKPTLFRFLRIFWKSAGAWSPWIVTLTWRRRRTTWRVSRQVLGTSKLPLRNRRYGTE